MANILVIEDDASVAQFLNSLLSAAGHSAATASDGEAGLNAACTAPPDLILCDMHLPRMTGWQVIRALKADAATRAVPVIALTAYGTAEDREEAYDAGCDAYEAKPIDVERLLMRVTAMLGARPRET